MGVSSYSEYVIGQRSYGKISQTAGTVITRLLDPHPNGFTRITGLRYLCGTTAHTLTIMRPCNRVYTTAAAAAAQAVINISADPGVYNANGTVATANNLIAANDFCVYQCADGFFVVDTVSSVSTLAITMTNNVPTSTVLKGAPFWFYGIITDTNPNNNLAHSQYPAPASVYTLLGRADAITTIPDNQYLKLGNGIFQPIIVHSGNATVLGTIESVGVEYVKRASA